VSYTGDVEAAHCDAEMGHKALWVSISILLPPQVITLFIKGFIKVWGFPASSSHHLFGSHSQPLPQAGDSRHFYSHPVYIMKVNS